jgi:short-subunit dehydrogenase
MRGRALITGASAGIGAALAKEFARRGHDLILTARSEARLIDLAGSLAAEHGIDARVIAMDLAAPSAGEALAARIAALALDVDILVNNAGLGVHGLFRDTDWAREREMMRVNQEIPVELCKRFLPGMIARGRGGILNVVSTSAYQPGPRMALYHAGKAFLLFFTDALCEELRGSGVTVTALVPGPTESEFQDRMGVRDGFVVKRILNQKAATVARNGYRALASGRRVAISGWHNRLGAALGKVLPWTWGARAVGIIQGARAKVT